MSNQWRDDCRAAELTIQNIIKDAKFGIEHPASAVHALEMVIETAIKHLAALTARRGRRLFLRK